MAVKLPNPKYIPKPYEKMQYPGQRVQIDVKYVPIPIFSRGKHAVLSRIDRTKTGWYNPIRKSGFMEAISMSEPIREALFRLQDTQYRAFLCRLIPTADPNTVIGVRTPELRKYAKQLGKSAEVSGFLQELPHAFFEENQLHAFLISEIRDFQVCLDAVDRFLPYVDNWATCDQMSPKAFGKHRDALPEQIRRWIRSDHTYTIRFGIGQLMQHFLDDGFEIKYPEAVAGIRSEEYYVDMMIAWYFATALAKQYDRIVPFLENRRLAPRTQNRAIRKALESFRIPQERKEYLRSLKTKPV